MTWDEFVTFMIDLLNNTFIKVLITTILFILLWWLSTAIIKGAKKRAHKRNKDKLTINVLFTTILWFVRVALIIVYASIVGIDTAGLAALVASAGVTLGLALQGSLSNLAGGIILIIIRPFQIDDMIEANGEFGRVENIKLFYTHIITPDNKEVMIPNGTLANGTIINYSKKALRRVDLTFSISYSDDVKKAISLIEEVCKNHNLVLKDQEILVKENAHSASSVDVVTKVWCNNDDYWTVYFDILSEVRASFDKNQITIPYPQLDVHSK